jgi:hypothetical protein
VYTIENGRAKLVPVTIGIRYDDVMEMCEWIYEVMMMIINIIINIK